jgi:hypothetical protein
MSLEARGLQSKARPMNSSISAGGTRAIRRRAIENCPTKQLPTFTLKKECYSVPQIGLDFEKSPSWDKLPRRAPSSLLHNIRCTLGRELGVASPLSGRFIAYLEQLRSDIRNGKFPVSGDECKFKISGRPVWPLMVPSSRGVLKTQLVRRKNISPALTRRRSMGAGGSRGFFG